MRSKLYISTLVPTRSVGTRIISLFAAMAVLALHLLGAAAPAAENPPPTREIYVPFSDLHVLLQNQPKRVLIGRQEYDELVKKAKRAPEAGAPLPAVLTAADYAITAGRQRAEIVGDLTVDVLQDGLHALPLDLAGVGLRSARLDDRAAAIGRGPDGRLVLFVEGIGQHRLKLEMTAPLETTAARQVLTYRLPRPATATLRLEVPGDVEIKGGADVIGRKVDAAANLTRFELLPRPGDTSLLMTLNSRLHRRERAVIARCVVLDEVTGAYEKLRATVTLSVLHRAVDRFRFVVPDGFEITEVASPLLARWEVVSEDGRRVLEARLREQTTETVTLGITAIRAPAKLEGWSAPRLVPLDVIGSVTVLGLLVDDRLKAESLSGEGLIPIDASVLGAVSPPLRAVAAWYAPRSDYALSARFVRPPAEMAATTSLLLVVSDKGLEVHGGVSLLPRVEKRFSFDFSVPAGWQVTSVATADGKPLPFERYPAAEGAADKAGRVRVTIKGGIEVNQIYRANFRAVRTPSGWLADWRRTTVEFPDFAVLDATSSEGAIAVEMRDDMTVRPEKIEFLTPLSAEEKLGFGLADVHATLAYRRQGPDYAASLVVERTEPRMTARTFSFLRVDRDALNCHCEVVYTIEQSRVRQLVFSLPKETPEGISIRGLDGVHVKERSDKLSGERRLWTVLLAEPRRDRVRLAVDFQQRLPSSNPKGFSLPIVEAEGVAYQSGLVAVEGCAELDVRVETFARQVDVGELAEADYQPGRRLLGAYGFVGDPPAVKIDVLRQPGYGIPPAIVQQCELDTVLSPDGRSQTQARFKLRSKSLYLQVELPADAKLWAAELDGVPLKPQRDGRSVLIDLSAGKDEALKTLKITYADDKLQPVALCGTVRVPAPKLFLRRGTGPFFGEKTISANKTPAENMDLSPSAIEVPLADFVWRLHLPSGYEVVRTGGTLTTDDISRPLPAVFQVAGALYYLSGGIWWSPLNPYKITHHQHIAEMPSQSVPSSSAKPYEPEKYRPVELSLQTTAETRIEAALESPTQLEFIETPLQDVIDYLKDQHRIEIQIDTRALADVGIGTDTPVTRNLKDVSLRSALRLTLHELGLTYLIQDGVLMITTPEEAETRLKTVVYPVADLVMDYRTKSGETWSDFDSLVEIITATVCPMTWDEVGGPGSVVSNNIGNTKTLVVSQTDDIHEQIKDILTQLRRVAQTPSPGYMPPLRERPSPQAGGRGTFGGGMGAGMGGMAGFADDDKSKADKKPSSATPSQPPAEKSAEDKKPESPSVVDRPLLGPAEKLMPEQAEKKPADAKPPVATPIEYPDSQKWAKLAARQQLAGVRSLKIDLIQSADDSGRVVAFRSLGVEPRLVVALADDSRFASLRWALALAVALVGLGLTRRSVRAKTAYVLVVMLLTTLFSLLGGIELAKACNMMFFAASLLVPYYLIVGFLRWLCRLCYRICIRCAAKLTGKTVVSAAILLAAMLGASGLQAAEDAKPQAAKERVVEMPDDAIILPYDPEWKNGIKDADKLLVPYKKYVELWNRAYPDKKIGVKAPLAPYALADASYKTLLEGDDFLLLTGRMEIDVFADGYVQVPLGLGGGVLTRAELDGKPARLSVLLKQDTPLAVSRKPNRSVVLLHVSGKGRHKLELAVRLKLLRQGGWRMIEGVLPSAPAAALDIVVPKARTELRLGHVADCRHYETEKADQTIRTALGKHGAISLRWRPEVAAGQIDRTLTVASSAVFDVREDGLRLNWQLTLEFRRAERDQFSVKLPEGYLLEKVEGANVRGWEVRSGDGGRTVEVSLLQAAKDREQFTLRLWRGGQVGRGELARFDVPVVTVADAALQSGRLTIRRSPLLEVRTLERSGVTRIDLPTDKKPSGATAGSSSSAGNTVGQANRGTHQFSFEQVLGIRPFESYSFATVPFTVRLSAAEVEARVSAVVESVLKLAEHQRSLESRVRFDVRGRPVYRLRVLLPEGFRLDSVHAPGKFQYTVTKEGKRPLLTIYLASGQEGEVPVMISGKLGRPLADSQREMPLPRVEVLDVDRQQGDIAVQADPAFDVEALDLTGCESVLLGRLFGWLNPRQREVARLALHYTGGGYAGKLRLKPRTADVVCDTITNVRVTDRSLEETILLDFNVTRAGVRRLEFLLPDWMADSRISVPMLQQPEVVPAGEKHPGMVRVRLELQEETMGQIRVVVENDRLLMPGSHQAPIPVIVGPEKGDSSPLKKGATAGLPSSAGRNTRENTAGQASSGTRVLGNRPVQRTVPFFRTNRRYVVIDNASRDEVVVEPDELRGMDVLGTHGKDWTVLKSFLGEKITMAYLVSPDAERPRLSFHAESRAAVETVQAGIGLSETTLVVDANGAYRAEVVLHVNNATEQYLEIRLPDGASLWTAQVAGEPVKPTLVPAPGATAGSSSSAGSNYRGNTAGQASSGTRHIDSVNSLVRIPLIKTAPGDLSYKVVLRYGGKMPALRAVGTAGFPLIRCVNITPELSQAKLHLPERFRWFDFGGTMRRVADDAGLQLGFLQFQSNQLSQISQALQSGDKWTKARAAYNLKQIELSMRDDVQYQSPRSSYNPKLQAALSENTRIMQQTQKEAKRQKKAPAQTKVEDNRQRLNVAYEGQTMSRAKNVVNELGLNWEQPASHEKAGEGKPMSKPQTKKMMVAPRTVIQEEKEEEKLGVRQGKRDRDRQTQQAPETEAYNRYQQRLARQTTTTDISRGELLDHDRSELNGRPAGEPSHKPGQYPTYSIVTDTELPKPAAIMPPLPQPTGLASLDFELPTRGMVYRFTTPRGEQEITARYLSGDVVRRLVELALVGVAVLVTWFIVGMVRRGRFDWLARPAGSWLLIGLGLFSLLAGVLPWAGIVAIVVGFGLKVRRLTICTFWKLLQVRRPTP